MNSALFKEQQINQYWQILDRPCYLAVCVVHSRVLNENVGILYGQRVQHIDLIKEEILFQISLGNLHFIAIVIRAEVLLEQSSAYRECRLFGYSKHSILHF